MTIGHNLIKDWIIPDWPAPATVRACVTTRQGGVSQAPYTGFNLGDHVGDDASAVQQNRQQLRDLLRLPAEPVWLSQVHSAQVVDAASVRGAPPQADASYTIHETIVCAVLTADCLPVLFCDKSATQIAAAHAGWRGLAAGVLENTLASFNCRPNEVLAWMGPAIGPGAFEVGEEVVSAFVDVDAQASLAFTRRDASHWLADIYLLATQHLQRAGVTHIYGGGYCTFSEPERFYSYRRDQQTGRMASLIWFDKQ